jgi:hypothetical protein
MNSCVADLTKRLGRSRLQTVIGSKIMRKIRKDGINNYLSFPEKENFFGCKILSYTKKKRRVRLENFISYSNR